MFSIAALCLLGVWSCLPYLSSASVDLSNCTIDKERMKKFDVRYYRSPKITGDEMTYVLLQTGENRDVVSENIRRKKLGEHRFECWATQRLKNGSCVVTCHAKFTYDPVNKNVVSDPDPEGNVIVGTYLAVKDHDGRIAFLQKYKNGVLVPKSTLLFVEIYEGQTMADDDNALQTVVDAICGDAVFDITSDHFFHKFNIDENLGPHHCDSEYEWRADLQDL